MYCNSARLLELEPYFKVEGYHPVNFDRDTRGTEKFSRIMRSDDKFSRIMRPDEKFARIMRSDDKFARIMRSDDKFSRIMRSDKFARIVRDNTKLLRILRSIESAPGAFLEGSDSGNTQYTESRVLRSPEIKFTRILRSGAELADQENL